MQFIKISFIILLLVYAVLLLCFCFKSGRTVKTLLLSSLSGLAVMTAINVLSHFTGVEIAVNGWSVSSSALFGIPGVLGMLIIRMFF